MSLNNGRCPMIACALVLTLLLLPGVSSVAAPPADPAAVVTTHDNASESVLITLSADSTSVVDLLQILASRSGLNIATSSNVSRRRISIRLRETPFPEALDLVCRTAGLGYERIGGSILVADPASLGSATGLGTRVFELHYADAPNVMKALEVISDEVRMEPLGNRVVVHAPQSSLEQADRIVRELDAKPLQVLFESRLIEVNISRLMELGINWEKLAKWSTVFTEGDQGSSPPGKLPTELGYVPVKGNGEKFFRQDQGYELNVDALITDGGFKVLANSQIVTLDGRPADIFAGDTVPVLVTSLQSPGGGGGVFQTAQLEKVDVGVRLQVTPRVGQDGLITTLVEPEVSRIVALIGPNNDLPQTSTRRAKTLVRVKDGQKVLLGGLLSDERKTTVQKVPLLGSIPLLGLLFQHHRVETIRLDLLIEITPHIIGDDGMGMAARGAPLPVPEQTWSELEKVRESGSVPPER